MISIEFLLTSLILAIVPGPGVIYTVAVSMTSGTRNGITAAVGCTLGIVPHLLVCIAGLSAIMHASAVVFSVLRYAGCIYLTYLAVQMWRSSAFKVDGHTSETRTSPFRIATKAIVLNLVNPKLTLFFFAFLPPFVAQGTPAPVLDLCILSLLFMLITLAVFVGYAGFAGAAKDYIGKSERLSKWIQRSFAAMLLAFAARLAAAKQ